MIEFDIEEIKDSVYSEIVRLEQPKNRSRYFIYGKVSEIETADEYSVVFKNLPARAIRDVQYNSNPLFRIGDTFIEGKFQYDVNGVKIKISKKVMRENGLDGSGLSKLTDYGIDYIMDGRSLVCELYDFILSKTFVKNSLVSALLNKTEITKLENTNFHSLNISLNESQKNAIIKSLNQNVTFIWGPPGTGKTKTMGVIAAVLIKMGKKVILTALSNKALDQLLLSTVESSLILKINDFTAARIGSVDNMHAECQIYSRDSFQDHRKRIRKLSFSWKEHVALCSCVASNFTSLVSPKTAKPGVADYVLADEMSMANIPSIIAASYYANCGIILGGDPMQLPPIYPEDSEKPNKWFSTNVFEMAEIKSRHDERAAFLDTQYRMQNSIGSLVSELFYDNELKTGTNTIQLPSDYKSNIIFFDCSGKVENFNGSIISENDERRYNENHAGKIAYITIKMLVNKEYSPEDIGVVAPYNAQIVKIKEMLEKAAKNQKIEFEEINKVQVSTIHSFQGQEKSVIIMNICDVDARPTRLTAKKELINVALSRAKELLIIVGSKNYLLDREYFSESEVAMFETIINSSHVINSD